MFLDWVILYQTISNNYDAITSLLKSHDIVSEAFLDTACTDLYVPEKYDRTYPILGRPIDTSICPFIYIAVNRDDALLAREVLEKWLDEQRVLARCKGRRALHVLLNPPLIALFVGILLYLFGIEPIVCFSAAVTVWVILFLFFICRRELTNQDEISFPKQFKVDMNRLYGQDIDRDDIDQTSLN